MLALGATYGTYPQKWPDEVFNLILDTTFAGGVAPNVTIVTQPF